MVTHRAAVDSEGRLQAMEIDVLLDGGAFRTLSPVVLSRAVLHAVGPYRCPNVHIRGKVLRTNTPPNGAFRGFGAPQVQFATERQMDRIGRRLGLDPLEIRLRNVLEEGDRLPTGQRMDESCSARLCLEKAARETDFQQRWQHLEAQRATHRDGEPSPGVGLSLYFHGAGFTGNGERALQSVIEGALLEDGRVEVRTAAVEMGQGCDTVSSHDGSRGQWSERARCGVGSSGYLQGPRFWSQRRVAHFDGRGQRGRVRGRAKFGDRVSGLVAPTVRTSWIGIPADRGRRRAQRDRQRARPSAKLAQELCARRWSPWSISRRHEPPEWQVFDEETYQGVAYPTYACGADVVEVEVDPDTLEAQARTKVTAVCEVGQRSASRSSASARSRAAPCRPWPGGMLEEVKVEHGRYLNDRLATYIIPTIRDSPRIEVHLLEKPWKGGAGRGQRRGRAADGRWCTGGRFGGSENATGIEIDAIPATPERLLALSSARRRVSAPPEDPEGGRGQGR